MGSVQPLWARCLALVFTHAPPRGPRAARLGAYLARRRPGAMALLVLPVETDAGAGPAARVDARLQSDMAADIEIQVHSIVLGSRSGRDADAHPVVDRAGRADESAAGGARADVKAVDAERFPHILECVGLTRQSRDRVRQLKGLERRQAAGRLLKQNARKDLIVR